MEEIKLNAIDKKLLAYLYYHSRDPATKIAKELKLTREKVAYRISKFEKENIIKNYIPLVNYSKLGYKTMSLLLLKLYKNQDIKKIKEKVKSSKNRINTVEILSTFDLGILFIFKDNQEKNDYFSEFLAENHKTIKNYEIIEPYFSEYYALKFLGLDETTPTIFHSSENKNYELDKKENLILTSLNKNANKSILKISEEAKISPELAVYKIKKLKQENILLSTRAHINMQKIGYFYTLILLNFSSFTKQNQDKLRKFAKENNNIDSLMLMFGKPNAYIQLFYKDIKELHNFLEKLKNYFSEEPLDISVCLLKNEGEDVNPLPFL